jgi:glutathione S-transferase
MMAAHRKELPMITLYGSRPHFGLPDPSPFVTKVETLLKIARLPYKPAEMSFRQAPKGKIPYIEDGGLLLGDSFFIRRHLEEKHGADFSGGYGAEALARAWAIERMLEEHLYFIDGYSRWIVDRNFNAGPRQFFRKAPAPLRPLVIAMVRRKVAKAYRAQGIGRHSLADQFILAKGDIDCVETLLGDNRYLLGDTVCGADATVFAFMLGSLCPVFDSDMRRYLETRPRITAYVRRMTAEFFPQFA